MQEPAVIFHSSKTTGSKELFFLLTIFKNSTTLLSLWNMFQLHVQTSPLAIQQAITDLALHFKFLLTVIVRLVFSHMTE